MVPMVTNGAIDTHGDNVDPLVTVMVIALMAPLAPLPLNGDSDRHVAV
jgi:hypothetical protein